MLQIALQLAFAVLPPVVPSLAPLTCAASMRGRSIPADFVGGRVFARWHVHGRGDLRLYTDTGGGGILLYAEAVHRLGLTVDTITSARGPVMIAEIPHTLGDSLFPRIPGGDTATDKLLVSQHERPGRDPSPNVWLEVHDAARLLEAARTYRPGNNEPRMGLAYPLLATFLLTGGRADEVLGLDLNDVLFDRQLIAFRPNKWRRGKKGKTPGSERMVPLWPQLEEILRAYLQGPHLELRLRLDPGLTLLFPSPETGRRIVDIRKMIDRVARRGGLPEGVYRATAFRKTYASARLQTLDNGAPVAPRTVQGELGHRNGDMIEKVYGRLGTVRHRSEVVEFRLPVAASPRPEGRLAETGGR